MNSTKTHRLAHLFALDDKCLIVALDHAGFMDQPLKGLERPVEMIRAVGRAVVDAFLVTLGSAQRGVAARSAAPACGSVWTPSRRCWSASWRRRCASAQMASSACSTRGMRRRPMACRTWRPWLRIARRGACR